MLDYLTNYGQQNISILTLVLSILIGTFISAGVVWTYRFTHKGLAYDKSFLVTLLLMGPIIALIITIIGNNIALSIGLVGSLSIIRFRTVIKDSRDLIYLLWGISVGLGSGTENWLATICASIVLALITLFVHWIRYGQDIKRDFVLVISGPDKKIEEHSRQFLKDEGFEFRLRSMDMSANDWRVVFEIQNKTNAAVDTQKIMGKLESLPSIKSASLLAPNLTLPI